METDAPDEKPAAPLPAQSLIVVLAKNASKIRSTVTFLDRRGIAAKYVQTLTEAVELFSKKEANMLLLSANFPHPKVEMLPVLMNQSFQIETILFAEESDRKTSSRLNGSKTKHVLFGPVSGPIVMMKIRQIEREMSGIDDDTKDPSQRRNGKSEQGDTISVSGKSEEEKKAALETLMKTLAEGDSEPAAPADENGKSAPGSDVYIQKGQRSEMKSETEAGTAAAPGATLSPEAQALRHGLDLGLSEAPPQKKRRLIFKEEPPQESGKTDEQLAAEKQARLLAEDAATKARAADRALEREMANEFAKERAGRAERARNDANKPAIDVAPGDQKSKSLTSIAEIPPVAQQEPEREATAAPVQSKPLSLTEAEIVQKCLREALTLVAGLTTTTGDGLTSYSTASLVSLTTAKLNLAFVIAIASSKQAAGDLFYRVEVAFFSLLRDCGFDFENRHTHSIQIDNMGIVERAFAGSDYVLVAKRPDVQVGVASVLAKNPVATVEPYEENMASVSVQDLPIDEPVTFNVFLHLKRNRRYLRYVKVGGVISAPQATRLSERHPNVLLDQDEVEAYRRHFAAHAIQPSKKRAS